MTFSTDLTDAGNAATTCVLYTGINTGCASCAIGKYAAAGTDSCIECAAGTVDENSDPSTACTNCAAGKITAAAAAYGSPDNTGTAAVDSININDETITLSSDASGFYVGDTVQLVSATDQTCTAAPLGSDLTVSAVNGAVVTFSTDLTNAGTDSNTKCVLSDTDNTGCASCAIGKYAAAGTDSCIDCASGTVDEDSDAATACTDCVAGKITGEPTLHALHPAGCTYR